MINFHEMWQYLCNCDYFKHPAHGSALSAFPTSLKFGIVTVSPHNNYTIEGDTETEVWLESGYWVYCDDTAQYEISHDCTLDVFADTFEEAITKLYFAVKGKEVEIDG